MAALEAELGVRLFHRSTSRLSLTPAGEELSRRARLIVADVDEAWAAVRRMDDVPRGLLRVSTVGDMLDDLLIAYVQDFPEVQVELVDTGRHVGLVDERIDVAVRFGPVTDANLIVRRVNAGIDRIVVASPAYLERNGHPASPDDLADHECICGISSAWPLRGGGRVAVKGRLGASSGRLLGKAARAGLGLALLPMPLVRDDLGSGDLVPVLREDVGDTMQASIVFTDREYLDAKVRVFIDRAVPALEALLGGGSAVADAAGSQAAETNGGD